MKTKKRISKSDLNKFSSQLIKEINSSKKKINHQINNLSKNDTKNLAKLVNTKQKIHNKSRNKSRTKRKTKSGSSISNLKSIASSIQNDIKKILIKIEKKIKNMNSQSIKDLLQSIKKKTINKKKSGAGDNSKKQVIAGALLIKASLSNREKKTTGSQKNKVKSSGPGWKTISAAVFATAATAAGSQLYHDYYGGDNYLFSDLGDAISDSYAAEDGYLHPLQTALDPLIDFADGVIDDVEGYF